MNSLTTAITESTGTFFLNIQVTLFAFKNKSRKQTFKQLYILVLYIHLLDCGPPELNWVSLGYEPSMETVSPSRPIKLIFKTTLKYFWLTVKSSLNNCCNRLSLSYIYIISKILLMIRGFTGFPKTGCPHSPVAFIYRARMDAVEDLLLLFFDWRSSHVSGLVDQSPQPDLNGWLRF